MRYRIKNGAPPHFIGGNLYKSGEIVDLPDHGRPGMWLEPLAIVEPVKSSEAPKRRGRPPKMKESVNDGTGA